MATQHALEIRTRGRGTTEITGEVTRLAGLSGIATGVAHIFVQHTSCALMITENADPAVENRTHNSAGSRRSSDIHRPAAASQPIQAAS